MPELPGAERARLTLESVLGRRIAAVDDSDTYVCRPPPPGEISSALVGHASSALGHPIICVESGEAALAQVARDRL